MIEPNHDYFLIAFSMLLSASELSKGSVLLLIGHSGCQALWRYEDSESRLERSSSSINFGPCAVQRIHACFREQSGGYK